MASKQALSDAKAQLPGVIDAMGGAAQLFDALDAPADTIAQRVRSRFEALHDLRRDELEDAYRELLASEEYRTIKQRMDTWCAVWFWPAGHMDAPMPRTWRDLPREALGIVDALASEHHFFHWEVEFPDVFRPDAAGFDVVIGNPPWDTVQTEPAEFFGRHDPFYRGYSKTEAGHAEAALFRAIHRPRGGVAVLSRRLQVNAALREICGTSLRCDTGSWQAEDASRWRGRLRARRPSLADRHHPFRHQGGGELITYKAFLEAAHHLGHTRTRIGLVVPAGLYTDKGSTALRRLLLDLCEWEWCYIFENKHRLFPIDSRYKFGPIVMQRGGSTTQLKAAFMRHDVAEWERPEEHALEVSVADIKRFSPNTLSLMEFKSDTDVNLVERIYGDRQLLGGYLADQGGHFNSSSCSTPMTGCSFAGLDSSGSDS